MELDDCQMGVDLTIWLLLANPTFRSRPEVGARSRAFGGLSVT